MAQRRISADVMRRRRCFAAKYLVVGAANPNDGSRIIPMKKITLALTFMLALLSASSFKPKPQADAGCCCPCFPQSKCNPQPNGGWTCDGGAERVQVLKDAARCLVRKFK